MEKAGIQVAQARLLEDEIRGVRTETRCLTMTDLGMDLRVTAWLISHHLPPNCLGLSSEKNGFCPGFVCAAGAGRVWVTAMPVMSEQGGKKLIVGIPILLIKGLQPDNVT